MAVPLAPPLQVIGVVATPTDNTAEGWVIAAVEVDVQPLASVTVTVKFPGASPVCVATAGPFDQA